MAIYGRQCAASGVILTLALSGCTSVKSTYLHRDDEDSRWATNHIKGIPVTLEVPTHVRFSVFETIYAVSQQVAGEKPAPTEIQVAQRDKAKAEAARTKAISDADASTATAALKKSAESPADAALLKAAEDAAVKAAASKLVSDSAAAVLAKAEAPFQSPAPKSQLQLVMLDVNQPLKTYNVTYDFITEKKIFGVDFKRPAAGPYSLTANFKGQYFSNVDHRLTDQTIEKVGEAVNTLIGQLVPKGGLPAGKVQSAAQDPGSVPTPLESLVCTEVFKIDAPDFELQVAAFLRKQCCAAQGVPVAGTPVGTGGMAPAPPPPEVPTDGSAFVPHVRRQAAQVPNADVSAASGATPRQLDSNMIRAVRITPRSTPPVASNTVKAP